MNQRQRLCCTVAEKTVADLRRVRDERAQRADLVELRLDALVGSIDVAGALADRTGPVIVTCRPAWEGGLFLGSEAERRAILLEAVHLGVEYVDVEWRADFRADVLAARGGRGVILSLHDFEGVPADLEDQVAAMMAAATDVVKIAVRITRLADCIRLAGLARRDRGRSIVVVGMGASGLATRLLPRRFGSAWSYAGRTAPGQVSAEDMCATYRFTKITDATEVYGVAGMPVSASLSPAMHNAWFDAATFDAVYLPFETDSVDDLLSFAEWLPLAGFSVTAPLKTMVFERLKCHDAAAEQAGAVNTVRRAAGSWTATNTDIDGFLAPLIARAIPLEGRRVSILGAGGAARAVAVALARMGADVTVHARRLDAAAKVARLAGAQGTDVMPAPGSWDLLVNATPVHWDDRNGLLAKSDGSEVVYDLISNPPMTPLLARARAAGYQAISGLEMLVAQAEAQAEWWNGRRPTPGVMRAAASARAMQAQGA